MKTWNLIPLLVFAISGCGGGGDSGGSSGGVVLPLAPSNLNAKADNTGVTVGWLSIMGADSYNLYYSTDPAFTVANYSVYANAGLKVNAASPLKITGLGNGPVYYFRATTVDGGKEGSPTGIVHAVTRYEITGPNGEFVKDKITGLEWQRCSLGQTWNAASETCDGAASTFTTNQTKALYGPDADGWRVPSRDEIRELVLCVGSKPAKFSSGASCLDYGPESVVAPAIERGFFPSTPFDRPFNSHFVVMNGNTFYCSTWLNGKGETCTGDTTGTQRLPNYIRLVRTPLLP